MEYIYTIEGLDILIEVDDINHEEDTYSSAVKTEVIKAIREMSGMNRKDFAKWLNIPYRTMSDWEHGLRVMPDYVLELIAYKVRMELVEKKRTVF